ncbi:MAG TPA: hypothetical protein IAA78_04300 [Candidatus Avamphibacillus intestinigallinarum]|nr:hypothetical protein [Candidatus Avamphibacillus intestinigallinarum]
MTNQTKPNQKGNSSVLAGVLSAVGGLCLGGALQYFEERQKQPKQVKVSKLARVKHNLYVQGEQEYKRYLLLRNTIEQSATEHAQQQKNQPSQM